jgi:TfoX/Sxy family transcriptional regulator of competence genes
MPSFSKSPQDLVDIFHTVMTSFPQATIRKTFGFPCAYVNNYMAAGLYADDIFVRLAPGDEAELLEIPGATSFAPMANRPMKGYVVLPESVRVNTAQLKMWIAKSLEYASGLPPKEKKAKSKKR